MLNGFTRELARYGPHMSYAPVSLDFARSYCRRLATTHYENFSVATLFLPRTLQRHFHNVYAYCRWADDLGDETGGGSHALRLLRWWREELLSCYAGQPHHPVMVALADTIHQFDIPPEPFLNLLYAFEQDQLIKSYKSLAQVVEYCRYSANPVGHLVLYLCRSYNADNAFLSDNICTALQLTNFWQDVARDFDIGRVYIPEEDRHRFAYTDGDLHARRYNYPFVDVMSYLVDYTRDLFYRGYPLIDQVPREMQADIELFIRGGLSILHKIEKLKYNVWKKRPVLSKWEKLGLMSTMTFKRVRNIVW